MSNSYNISVAPELAALDVKIDANKAVIDANAVILVDVHDTDLPAVKTVVDANEVILVDVHDTDLPAVKTVVDANAVILVDVHDTDLPAVKTVVDATGVKADNLQTMLTDIHDTDLPAVLAAVVALVLRGELELGSLTHDIGAAQEVINITGSGKIIGLWAWSTNGATQIAVDMTIDGRPFNSGWGAQVVSTPYVLGYEYNEILPATGEYHPMNIGYQDTLRVRTTRGGAVNNVSCYVIYSVD